MFNLMGSYRMFCAALLVTLLAGAGTAQAADPMNTPEGMDDGWDIKLNDFYKVKDGTIPFTIYARSVDGKWLAAVGSSRGNFEAGGRPRRVYNTSWQYVDMSEVPIKDGKMKGQIEVWMTPDLWIPLSHRSFKIVFDVEAKLNDKGFLDGKWTAKKPDIDEPTLERMNFTGGTISSFTKPQKKFALPDTVTLNLNMQGVLYGAKPDFKERCMVLSLGFKDGKLVKASHGVMSLKKEVYAQRELSLEGQKFEVSEDGFSGQIRVPSETLDLEPCVYVIDVVKGHFQGGLAVGVNDVTVKREGKEDVKYRSSFDGQWHGGVTKTVYENRLKDKWYVEVKDHDPVKAGEHPRLLFRESDLPKLRERAKTPEGQAILKRLRYLLNAGDGKGPARVYSKATHAYMGGGYSSTSVNEPGVYTFSHVAGYGLLYQLTGDKKYADLGADAFERALKGQRDRDDRYSFREPGGALRAGPVLGWYAVGYDLCYDGWDKATRQKFTKAIAEYAVDSQGYDLEDLARGTMPPGSNHYGMQVGGASLALLAIKDEPGIDDERVELLLRIARRNMIRNITEGFGDGGFFKEGDGTGSMATYITYLSGLEAWKNVEGFDFVNSGKPHVPMLTLKWLYQTRFGTDRIVEQIKENRAKGKDVGWDRRWAWMKIRGAYPHNVWARSGLSGAGYFAIGFTGLTDEQKAAHLWFYNQHLKPIDDALGKPFDTVSVYPHLAVNAFVNWPFEMEPKDPAKVLPLAFADSEAGFFAWRNDFDGKNDVLISVATGRTRGYHGTKADNAVQVNGEPWAEIRREGGAADWWTTPKGDLSVLTLEKGTALVVDFTGKPGVPAMLATTCKAKQGETVKVGRQRVTFLFPSAEKKPEIKVDGDTITIGKRQLTLKDGKLDVNTPSGAALYIEAESIALADGWVLESSIDDHSGSGYLHWILGRNRKASKGRLSYEFDVPSDGRYVITLRARRDREGECKDVANDKCNDVFTEINDLGPNKTMVKGKWDQWIWQSRAIVDGENRRPAVYELKAGKNTLHVSGRSAGVKFDAFTVHPEGTERPEK
ncbi:MAG: hypothetical protein GF355_02245 [Candidatus Eisenbacteria bacterium]|nr:hypothetical protein [Candidatus Eisenbacteria bacterium]